MMHKSANVRCNVHARQWKSHKTSIKGYNARFISVYTKTFVGQIGTSEWFG